MKKSFLIILAAIIMSGCIVERDIFVPTTGGLGCSIVDYDYSHTEFDCPNYYADYVFCDPYGEIRRPGCWYSDEAPETYMSQCYSRNVCGR
tara:strand:+ start:141 stop:413 length:273 start_codon:yes stop_codon:yes gene_type:complete